MLRIITQQADVIAELQRICNRTNDEQVFHKEATVKEVLQAVKSQGDKALLHYTAEFDKQKFTPEELRVSDPELNTAYQKVSSDLLEAIKLSCSRIEAFHRQRVPKDWVHFGADDVVLGKRYTPVDRAGDTLNTEKSDKLKC